MKRFIKHFLQLESASGLFLFLATLFALVVANSPYAAWHQAFVGRFLFWINDGLMTLFFFVIGLELKQGYLSGQLTKVSQVALPGFAAIGGMLVPALIYVAFNWGHPLTLRGWPTPVATDIAFALAVLGVFGSRVPQGLKLFLMALAIFDDLGAILIIALLYSTSLTAWAFAVSLLLLAGLAVMNRRRVMSAWAYALVGVLLWLAVLKSGIHPTLAGVLLAFFIPGQPQATQASLLQWFQHRLHPWVAYLVMPIFAFVNMGFPLSGLSFASLDGVVQGIALGLFVGKQIGVLGFSWWCVQAKFATLPEGVTWPMIYGVAILCGIGFTMSLFLGTLSFEHEVEFLTKVRLAVLIGSSLSAMVGAWVLSRALK